MKGVAVARKAQFNSAALRQKILVDGLEVVIYQTNNEDFDIYIFTVLSRIFERRHALLKCYNEYFDYDWSDQSARVMALNQLYDLNLRRVRKGKPAIPLFSEA